MSFSQGVELLQGGHSIDLGGTSIAQEVDVSLLELDGAKVRKGFVVMAMYLKDDLGCVTWRHGGALRGGQRISR